MSRAWPLAVAVLMGACGSASVKDVTTTPSGLLDPSQPRTEPTVIISASGVDPVDSHLNHPVTVTFVNRDSVAHRLESAPEIGNGPCPEMAQVGTVDPGGTGTVTLTAANYICSFHDGLQPANLKLKGIIVVH
jgi:plastocyanin